MPGCADAMRRTNMETDPRLACAGSGSSGNCYIIRTSCDFLIVDLGVRFRDILAAINYGEGIRNVRGCLVTHVHQDHSSYIPDALMYRLPVYSCAEVAEKWPGVAVLEHGHRYRMGGFTVMPLHVPHNAENYAYVIDHPETGRILFATDLVRFPYTVRNIDTVMIEANYSDGMLVDRLCSGADVRSRPDNHMSVDEAEATLVRLYGPQMKRVVLIHLSDGNSDERAFLEQIGAALPSCKVYAAERGMEIPIGKDEF